MAKIDSQKEFKRIKNFLNKSNSQEQLLKKTEDSIKKFFTK